MIITSINEYLNKDGNIVAYHGTDVRFNIFNDNDPIFFVDNLKVAKTYGEHIIKAELDIERPIELDFTGKSTYYFIDKWYRPSELAIKIKEYSNDIKNHYTLDDDVEEELLYLGYDKVEIDGIIMYNIQDAKDGIFSSHRPVTNYVVFNKDQIKVL